MSRAYTEEEVRKMFLDQVKGYIEYWDKQLNAPLDGLAFSILNIIDGTTGLPKFKLSADPHPDDKQYAIDEGSNYYEPGIDISGCLHDEWYK